MDENSVADSPPRGRGPKAIHDWVQARVASGQPRGPLYLALLRASIPDDMEELDALSVARNNLGDILVNRNTEGIAAEKRGDDERAIELYEANVADRFDGSHPYERLRKLYADLERYADAIRVCETYLQHVAQDPKLCDSYRRWVEKYRQKG